MNKATKYILIAFSLLVISLFVWFLGNIIAYILVGLVLSLILQPITRFLNKIKIKRFSLPSFVSAILTLVIFWAIIYLFFQFTFPLIANEVKILSSVDPEKIVSSLDQPLKKVTQFLSSMNIYTGQEGNMTEVMVNRVLGILNLSDFSMFFSSLANTLGQIFIAFFAITFICFFFLKQENLFLKALIAIVPVDYEMEVKHILLSTKKLLMRYFIGIIFDMFVIFILTTIGMLVCGLEFQHALVIGLVGGLFNIIPYVGPIISIIFGMLIGILTHADANFYVEILPLLGWMLIAYVIINILDATLIQPFIFSSSVKAHPLEVFLVILSAGTLAGVPGMILAIPSYTVLRVIAKEFFHSSKIVKKLTKNI